MSTRIREGRTMFSKKSNASLKRPALSSVMRPKKRMEAGRPAPD